LVFIAVVESVYSAVRTDSLYKALRSVFCVDLSTDSGLCFIRH